MVEELILENFPDCDAKKLKVEGTSDSGVTGNFEITVNGKLVHSKKKKGHGFLTDNKVQQKVVFKAIETELYAPVSS